MTEQVFTKEIQGCCSGDFVIFDQTVIYFPCVLYLTATICSEQQQILVYIGSHPAALSGATRGTIRDFFQIYTKKSYQPQTFERRVNARIHDSKREFS